MYAKHCISKSILPNRHHITSHNPPGWSNSSPTSEQTVRHVQRTAAANCRIVHRVCKWMCVCDGERLLLSAKEWKGTQWAERVSECTRDCQHVCGGVCVCRPMWERVGSAEKGKDEERERGNKERKRKRVGSMQRFWAWSANWSFPLDYLFPGPVYLSLMDGFPFRRNLEMPLWGQNVCINSKTKQKMN